MLNELDLSELLRRIEYGSNFGLDEILVPTLHASDALQAPGGFTHVCIDKDVPVEHVTRMSLWVYRRDYDCLSGHVRHAICVLGMEDLGRRLPKLPHLFVNKMMPDFDFRAILCWYEHLFNRTHMPECRVEEPSCGLDENYYRNLPHVRFQQFKGTSPESYKSQLQTFNCHDTYISLADV
jgi:hypothetical protein